MTGVDAILRTVVEASSDIRDGLATRREKTSSENPSGDSQIAADRWIDDLLFERLGKLDAVGQLASEEQDSIQDVGDGYSVAIDPLDGSSNLRSNNVIGTILGVYDAPLPARGRDLVASAFVLYGPYTTMTVARDGDVETWTLDKGKKSAAKSITMPESGEICGCSGLKSEWQPPVRDYVDELREQYKLRYSGAMVADVQQLLTHGGFLAYPALDSQPNGVLRLQFESNPIAYLVEAAGGASSNGSRSILDCEPTSFHQSIPTYFGAPGLIDELETKLQQ